MHQARYLRHASVSSFLGLCYVTYKPESRRLCYISYNPYITCNPSSSSFLGPCYITQTSCLFLMDPWVICSSAGLWRPQLSLDLGMCRIQVCSAWLPFQEHVWKSSSYHGHALFMEESFCLKMAHCHFCLHSIDQNKS